MKIDAKGLHYRELNDIIKKTEEKEITVLNCEGQRYIGCALTNKIVTIEGVPGNALGAYLDGSTIIAENNVQDAAGDTMNGGKIFVYGSAGDAAGYAMRGGRIYIRGGAGYRAGIHMKAYQEKQPVLVIGGTAGDFLGEYQAGGTIVVLGLGEEALPVGAFCGTGMHGGRIFIRSAEEPSGFPPQVTVSRAGPEDLKTIEEYLDEFCGFFQINQREISQKPFFLLTPDTKNPYRRLYVGN